MSEITPGSAIAPITIFVKIGFRYPPNHYFLKNMFALPILAVAGTFPTYFVAVYVVGLVAAVSIGLVAWYNSKRPVGWERSKRPDFIPKINTGSDSEPPRFTPPENLVEPPSNLEAESTPANSQPE